MLDPMLLAAAVLLGGAVAAMVVWLATPRLETGGVPRPGGQRACWSWAVGAGLLAASSAPDQWPHWPPLEDRARFLVLVVPLTLLVETWGTSTRSAGTVWLARLGLAVAVTPLLLHGSVYLTDLTGLDSAEWSSLQAILILVGLAALLVLVWAGLCGLQARTSTRTVLGLLALDAFAVAVTVMLSGYYRGGLLGLGLAGAISGCVLASYLLKLPRASDGSLGMSVVGIFAVVIMGHFFGTLSNVLAGGLLVAPLMPWTVEFSPLRKIRPTGRGVLRWTCVAVPLLVILVVAQRKFTAASTARPRMAEPSATGDDRGK